MLRAAVHKCTSEQLHLFLIFFFNRRPIMMRPLRGAIVAVLCLGAVAPCAGFSASQLPVMSRRFLPRTASLACACATSAPNSREPLAHKLSESEQAHWRLSGVLASLRPLCPFAAPLLSPCAPASLPRSPLALSQVSSSLLMHPCDSYPPPTGSLARSPCLPSAQTFSQRQHASICGSAALEHGHRQIRHRGGGG